MKSKMNFKSFIIMAVVYGGIMGFQSYMDSEDLIISIVVAIITGLIFSLLMSAIFRMVEKKASKVANKINYQIQDGKLTEKLRKEIEADRKVIYDDFAGYKTDEKPDVIGRIFLRKYALEFNVAGWMFLSESALEFYKLKGNFSGENIAILLDDIVSTSIKNKQSLIVSTGKKDYIFTVNDADIWKEKIDLAVVS